MSGDLKTMWNKKLSHVRKNIMEESGVSVAKEKELIDPYLGSRACVWGGRGRGCVKRGRGGRGKLSTEGKVFSRRRKTSIVSGEEMMERNFFKSITCWLEDRLEHMEFINTKLGIFQRGEDMGLYAMQDIRPGEYIGQYHGNVVSTKFLDTYVEACDEARDEARAALLISGGHQRSPNRLVVVRVNVPIFDLNVHHYCRVKFLVLSRAQYISDTKNGMTPNCIMDNYGGIWAKKFIPGDSSYGYHDDYRFLSELRMRYGDILL